ncbi:MAG: hypothetical protein WA071_00780 [Undibacterium umbellatum]|uniref:hypothetical protein n=1 Tax=Undibacterium umbellatum TaxID=2762300 RepID=UPI003BB4AD51
MPTDEQVVTWLQQIYKVHGQAKGLMCETVLLSALRREEIACWRYDTLPEDPTQWQLGDPNAPYDRQRVLVDIKFGTKGKFYGLDHGDKIGPSRSIWIPLHLAERIHEYRNKLRNLALRKWIKITPTLAEQQRRIKEAVHLFRHEISGERITSKNLYDAWTSVQLPYKGWSPHLGRDWWACSVLWQELKRYKTLCDLGSNMPDTFLESTAMSIIRLQIQPQLGHAYDSTTMIYLQWVMDMIGVGPEIRYDRELDDAELVTK